MSDRGPAIRSVRATVAQTSAGRASAKPTPLAENSAVRNQGVRTVRGARGWAPPPSDTAPLPAEVLKALRSIVADMRSIPREVITDRGELIHFLNRMAGRVDGVAKLRVAFTPPAPKRLKNLNAGFSGIQDTTAPTSPLSGHALAHAVFGTASTVSVTTGSRPDVGGQSTAPAGKGLKTSEPPSDTPQRVASRRRDETRTVTSRKGKAVPVHIRRAREAGQMELGV